MSSREGRDHAKLHKYPMHLLDTQYRMHPAIAEWPSTYFYSRKLHTDRSIEQLRRSPLLPYVILSLESGQADARCVSCNTSFIIFLSYIRCSCIYFIKQKYLDNEIMLTT